MVSQDIFDDLKNETELSAVGVHAGFPNPAAQRDHKAPVLSLDRLLISRPSSTYFFRLRGHTWEGQGIGDGDIAVVDRSLRPTGDDMVVAWQDDFLMAPSRQLPADTAPWGVVVAIVHCYERGC